LHNVTYNAKSITKFCMNRSVLSHIMLILLLNFQFFLILHYLDLLVIFRVCTNPAGCRSWGCSRIS